MNCSGMFRVAAVCLGFWFYCCGSVQAQSVDAAEACEPWRARFIAVDGTVELRRQNSGDWQAAEPGLVVCDGDTVRVSAFGRSSVELADRTLLNLDRNTQVSFSSLGAGQTETQGDAEGSLLDLRRRV